MKTSQKGVDFIKSFEGLVLTAYKPVKAEPYYTIGYGHYGADVKPNQTITKAEAERILKNDLIKYETAVTAYNYCYHWSQNEFDALVSFTYNCGVGSFKNLIKNGTRSRAEIRNAILLYNKDVSGRTLAGLVRRRKAELELFNKPVSETSGNATQPTEKDYKTVDDIVKGIWAGEFGTPWSKSDKLYKYFLKKVNEYKGAK